MIITEPGIYDIPEADYHRDPVPGGSLSASTAKRLLAEGGPARYRYLLDHPEEPSGTMELGTAAHKLVLGVGAPIVEIQAENWRKDATKEAAAKARAAGGVPLLTADVQVVHEMAAALRKRKTAVALLNPSRGDPERSVFWIDQASGLWKRARFDFMPRREAGRLPVIVDYKTCASAGKRDFPRSVDSFGYHIQAAQYCDAWRAIHGTDPGFVFLAQETKPPYLTAYYQLDAESLAIGRQAMADAMETWRDCRAAEAQGAEHAWPGYSDEIETIALPRWSRAREDYYA
ncbi:MAG TPA: PD-(D/E)XK nuclease-like domain-containing protein [Trebonia sp.]|nr:PD-(D/E)XK nuclease-like domain-containing protein [Trebonia sp.]